jgi:hypothetical protein
MGLTLLVAYGISSVKLSIKYLFYAGFWNVWQLDPQIRPSLVGSEIQTRSALVRFLLGRP